jgi:hypothetical protein
MQAASRQPYTEAACHLDHVFLALAAGEDVAGVPCGVLAGPLHQETCRALGDQRVYYAGDRLWQRPELCGELLAQHGDLTLLAG